MLTRASSRILRPCVTSVGNSPFSNGIKLLNERGKAEEDYYFSKQDEKLIKHMIQEDSHLLDAVSGERMGEPTTAEDKIKLVFMKNGIPPNANPKLLSDLVELFGKK